MIFLLEKDRFVVNQRVRMKMYPKDKGGLGDELTASVDAMKGELDKAKADIESSKAMTDMAEAVSAVEGVANDAANAVADATNAVPSVPAEYAHHGTAASAAAAPPRSSPRTHIEYAVRIAAPPPGVAGRGGVGLGGGH